MTVIEMPFSNRFERPVAMEFYGIVQTIFIGLSTANEKLGRQGRLT